MFRLNFNTVIYPIYGLCLGINYWNSELDFVAIESQLDGETEHCLQIELFIVGISFIWYTKS